MKVDLFDQEYYANTAHRLSREVDYIDEESSQGMCIKLDTTTVDLGLVS